MQITELVRGTSKDYSPAPEKQVKWRNVFFTKNAGSYRGNTIWDTQDLAESHAQRVRGQAKGLIPNSSSEFSGWTIVTLDGEFDAKNYAWHMQIPILQD